MSKCSLECVRVYPKLRLMFQASKTAPQPSWQMNTNTFVILQFFWYRPFLGYNGQNRTSNCKKETNLQLLKNQTKLDSVRNKWGLKTYSSFRSLFSLNPWTDLQVCNHFYYWYFSSQTLMLGYLEGAKTRMNTARLKKRVWPKMRVD